MPQTKNGNYDLESIGTVAGCIWEDLAQHGPMTLSRLAKEIAVPRDLVMQGVGWLAREGKVIYRKGSRSKLIDLS